MTEKKTALRVAEVKKLFSEDQDGLRELPHEIVRELMESEISEQLGASPYERSKERRGYRAGYYERSMRTRLGKIELRVPQDRKGEFKTGLFERCQRSGKAFITTIMEMCAQGVSTRKVTKITEERRGCSFIAGAVGSLNVKLDQSLERFARRRMEEARGGGAGSCRMAAEVAGQIS